MATDTVGNLAWYRSYRPLVTPIDGGYTCELPHRRPPAPRPSTGPGSAAEGLG